MSLALSITADDVVLVPPQTVPKTSSGKLKRSACKDLYINNKLNKKRLSLKMSFVKLGSKWLAKNIGKNLTKLGSLVYTLYMASIVAITLGPIMFCMFLAKRKYAAKVFKLWMRSLLLLSFCPFKIKGKDNLYLKSPNIFVTNHSSYVDAVFLTAFLPSNVIFVGKESLFKVPILGFFFNKLGYISINKMDYSQSLGDMKKIEESLKQGSSVLIFPEGTFNYSAGLRPFKLGAFKIAAELNLPVCPIALHGTRYFLRGNEFLMMPHALRFIASKPIYATGKNLSDVVVLKDRVRTEISANSNELSLDFIIPALTGLKKSVAEV